MVTTSDRDAATVLRTFSTMPRAETTAMTAKM